MVLTGVTWQPERQRQVPGQGNDQVHPRADWSTPLSTSAILPHQSGAPHPLRPSVRWSSLERHPDATVQRQAQVTN